ncbi:MAG: L17 family ribosomal protein [Candidatus Absconditabacteria bacterium]|nr:L17 family ribosomal protein [Candidatus Absconditabacteria bacterium]
MRHQKKRLLKIDSGAKKKSVYLRVLLTNLIKNGKLSTTQKRAKVVKADADHFFSKLLEITARFKDEKDARRECIRYITSIVYGDEGKKVIDVLLPKYIQEGRKTGFVASYNLGFRVGDAAPKVLLKLL